MGAISVWLASASSELTDQLQPPKHKEIQVRNIILAVVVVVVSIWSADAMAARDKATNAIFFDASGNIVGQDLIRCSNQHFQGGIGSIDAPYVLRITSGCGTPVTKCDYNEDGLPDCVIIPGDYSITYSVTPALGALMTANEACLLAEDVCVELNPKILTEQSFEVIRVYGSTGW
jgi:hypothetical protein